MRTLREEVAERYHVKAVSGKIPIPDLRVEYVNENDNEIHRRDLERQRTIPGRVAYAEGPR